MFKYPMEYTKAGSKEGIEASLLRRAEWGPLPIDLEDTNLTEVERRDFEGSPWLANPVAIHGADPQRLAGDHGSTVGTVNKLKLYARGLTASSPKREPRQPPATGHDVVYAIRSLDEALVIGEHLATTSLTQEQSAVENSLRNPRDTSES